MYILQLMILENDFKICYSQRNKYSQTLKIKEETLKSKNEEIKFLKERLKSYEIVNYEAKAAPTEAPNAYD